MMAGGLLTVVCDGGNSEREKREEEKKDKEGERERERKTVRKRKRGRFRADVAAMVTGVTLERNRTEPLWG